MAYSDGLTSYVGAVVEGEAAAADLADVFAAGPLSVEAFGGITTEAWDVAGANAHILSLDISSDEAEGDRTEIATVTFPKALADGPVGAIFWSTSPKLPAKVPAGGHFTLEAKQAASDAGGAYRPFAAYRVDGYLTVDAFPTAKSKGVAA